MRIGLLAPVAWPVPPITYGGWELVVANLAEGLVARGHDVTVFASGDSRPPGKLVSLVPRALNHDPDLAVTARAYEALHIAHAFAHAGELDLLHNHAGSSALCHTGTSPVPVVTTLHGSGAEPDSRVIYRHHARLPYVSISDAERLLCPELRYVATVYNGIAVERFPVSPRRTRDELVYIGRMSPDKGVHLAVEVARRTGIPLILAGIIPPENAGYWREAIAPALRPGKVEFVGPVTHDEKVELLTGALGFAHLVTYEESFGLTMVEAMACGTPVLAMRRGSVPEIVVDGVTGCIADDVDQAVAAVERLAACDRRACRRRVEDHFSIAAMTGGYERVYQMLTT